MRWEELDQFDPPVAWLPASSNTASSNLTRAKPQGLSQGTLTVDRLMLMISATPVMPIR
jgi:hypothetical protein